MKALKYHWCETSLLAISSCFEARGVQRFHLQEVCVRGQFCILPRMKKYCSISHVMFKRNFYMWVTSVSCVRKSYPDCSVGQWVKWVNRCDPLSTLSLTSQIVKMLESIFVVKDSINEFVANNHMLESLDEWTGAVDCGSAQELMLHAIRCLGNVG